MIDRGELLIRRAEPRDAEGLAELAGHTFQTTFAASNRAEDMALYVAQAFGPAQQLAEITAAGIRTLVVVRAGLIAFAQLRGSVPPLSVTSSDPIELWRFYVDRRWHGQGVAQLLMRAVSAEAVSLGASSIWLGVWEHNPRAAAFYRKCGFVEVGEQKFQLGHDLQTDQIMLLSVLLA